MPFLPQDHYANWVATQIRGDSRKETPTERVRKHRDGWRNLFDGIVKASGVYEVPALVVSRWEYLGSLYRGNTRKTNCRDAIVFAKRFLEKVNPRYSAVHNLAGRSDYEAHDSDIFTMLRNKTLHGTSPAGIETETGDAVASWLIGPGPMGAAHLDVDELGRLQISTIDLYEDLLNGMTLFADYLEQNTERSAEEVLGDHLPQERWLRAAWARYRPHAKGDPDEAAWMARGIPHGIPG